MFQFEQGQGDLPAVEAVKLNGLLGRAAQST